MNWLIKHKFFYGKLFSFNSAEVNVFAALFFYLYEVRFIDNLEHGKTINKQYDCELLQQLGVEIKISSNDL